MKFSELNLNPSLLQGIDDAGFIDCLPVQERTYEHALKSRDVLVQSQTGSGKTAAFLVSIYQLFTDPDFKYSKRALIIAPTRELAVQIEDEAKLLGSHLPYHTGCFYGGVGYHRQEQLLERGVDIIIGTPGRLIDLNESGKLDFSDVGILIIDEADRLFDMGFLPDLRRMIKKLPDYEHRQTMLFSATLSTRVRELAAEYMTENPAEVEIEPEQVTVQTVSQAVYHVERAEKMKLLLGLLKKENPGSALIFTNMKSRAMEVARRLAHNGFTCEYIIGDLPQSKRLSIINAMKAGSLHILVATDVAARGLHINDLDLVVNYDLPEDPEAYVHRIGRTARAGKSGKAITIACEKYVYGLEAVEALINMKIPVVWAADEDFVEDASAGMRFHDERKRQGGSRQGGRSAPGRGKLSERRKPAEKSRRPEAPKAAGGKPGHEDKPAKLPRKQAESRPEGKAGALPPDQRQDQQGEEKKKRRRRRKPAAFKPREAASAAPVKAIEYYSSELETPKKRGSKIIGLIKGIFSRKKTKST